MEALMNKVSFEGIAEWFTGKKAEKAAWAIDQINASLEAGEWILGVSRTAKAALDKVNAKALNVAKMAEKLERALPYYSDKYPEHNEPGAVKGLKEALRAVYWALKYGSGSLDEAALALIEAQEGAEYAEIAAAGRRVLAGRAPIVQAIAFLDSQRPKPVFVLKTLSPTGAKLLLDAGYKPDTCRLPEFRYFRDEEGRPEMEIIWPEGTKHGKSRFCRGTAQNFQCHACGHAIKNMSNWVPLAIDNKNGETHSFWVGRDCAKKLFGVDMKGDAQYKNVEGR
jgi:hypothetical protein